MKRIAFNSTVLNAKNKPWKRSVIMITKNGHGYRWRVMSDHIQIATGTETTREKARGKATDAKAEYRRSQE